MAERPRRDERKALLRELKQRQRAAAEARMPLSKSELGELFNILDEQLERAGCDHTLAITREFLASRELSEDAVVPWLAEYGGFCDCEVLANVESEWGDRLRG